jgi:hypothetical protein
MVHVWQIFNPELTEARDALAEIGRFLAEAAPPRAAARACAAAGGVPAVERQHGGTESRDPS